MPTIDSTSEGTSAPFKTPSSGKSPVTRAGEHFALADRSVEAGYASALYARSLGEFGNLRELPRSGGWILVRPIPQSAHCDGMGTYPLFSCGDWTKLEADLAAAEIAERLVTVTVVADPFGNHTMGMLQSLFDVLRPMKTHYVVDLTRVGLHPPIRHHQVRAKRALRYVDVEIHQDGRSFLDEWGELYAHLVIKHSLSGIPAFSREAFLRQLSIPGLVLFRATRRGRVVGMHLWYQRNDVAYSHLIALDPSGYKVGAAFALHETAIQHFRSRVRWLDLGGGAGVSVWAGDGLAAFKRGWANDERLVFLCGRILIPSLYVELGRTAPRGINYFPIYRAQEHFRTFGSRLSIDPRDPPLEPQ